jgi:hypothetical protein
VKREGVPNGVSSVIPSEVFCSGKVEAASTKKVEFSIPAVQTFCDNGGDSWTKVCEFSFVVKD